MRDEPPSAPEVGGISRGGIMHKTGQRGLDGEEPESDAEGAARWGARIAKEG